MEVSFYEVLFALMQNKDSIAGGLVLGIVISFAILCVLDDSISE